MERKYYVILTILWVAFITTLSLVSFNRNNLITIQNTDKIVHFLFYFILALLFLKSFNNKYLTVIVLAVSYGIVIEILQNEFTLTRKGDFYDVVANSIGVFSAVLLNKFIFKTIFSNFSKKN